MKKKDEAFRNLRKRFHDRTAIMGATNSTTLAVIAMKKAVLLGEPCPTVAQLAEVYGQKDVPMEFVRQLVRHVYLLKENRLPEGSVETVQAGAFLVECSRRSVWQCLCFLAEYPGMRQYGKGFDYSHFSSAFRDYSADWTDAINRRASAILAEEQRRKDEARAATDGWTSLKAYVQSLIDSGTDPRHGGLYLSGKVSGLRQMVDAMCQGKTFDDLKTASYGINCCATREAFLQSVRERRLRLPDWLLTQEERAERDAAF